LLMLYSGLAFSPLAIFGGLWGNAFLQTAFHIHKPAAASLSTMMFLGFAVGGPVLGLCSIRTGKTYALMTFGILLSLFGITLAIYIPSYHRYLEAALLFLFGFGTAGIMLGFAVGKSINAVALAATVIALINTGDAFFGAFSETVVGKFLDVFWHGTMEHGVRHFDLHDYHIALALLPVYLILSLLCLWGSKK